MKNQNVTITVPGGLWDDGKCKRDVTLRPPVGEDELALGEAGDWLLPVQWITELLARCVVSIGTTPADRETVRSMTIGDREALLLIARRLTFGDSIPCALYCPDSACGQRLDLELRVSELLVPPYSDHRHWNEVILDGAAGRTYRVRFRLPTGADQEMAVRAAERGIDHAAELLIRACIDEISTDSAGRLSPSDWPGAVLEQVPALMADLDPQAELTLNMTCPACDNGFSALFDAGGFMRHELRSRTEKLYREVHLLATRYHWEEQTIMQMASKRRHIYLDLCAETVSAEAYW